MGQSLKRVQGDKKERFGIVPLQKSFAEKEEKFELNVFLVGTTCKRSV